MSVHAVYSTLCMTDVQAAVPFAVMGSNTVVEINGRKVRGRLYPWGIVEGL